MDLAWRLDIQNPHFGILNKIKGGSDYSKFLWKANLNHALDNFSPRTLFFNEPLFTTAQDLNPTEISPSILELYRCCH